MNPVTLTDLPGPPRRWWGLPLMRDMARDYLGFAGRLQRLHGDRVAMRLVTERTVDLFHPDDVRAVLVDHADDLVRWERGTEVFSQTFGQGLLVAEGQAWRRQRRMLTPAFHPRHMTGWTALMNDAARGALDAALSADPGGGVQAMDALFQGLTMDVMMRTLFSSRAPALAQAAAQATQVLSHAALREMFWPVSPPAWLPLRHNRHKQRALAVLAGLVDGQIAARRAMPAAQRPTDDLLALLLAARDEDGSGLAPAEVHDQCMVMFQAGHETTATALLWWSWLLAGHPQAAQRARQEVDTVLQGADPAADSVTALPYLAATLKEAMRLYPPVAAVMTRRLLRPIALRGLVLPAGTLVRITPWVMHRDGRWFTEPDRFMPERFLAEAGTAPRGAWMPFGAGPRVCIGQHFAMLEMTLVAALMLQRCTLHRRADEAAPQPRLGVTLRPAEPLRLQLLRRPAPSP